MNNSRDKKPFQSKKFIAMTIGLSLVFIFFISSLIVMLYKPEVASSIVSLTTTSIGVVGTIISVYAGGQAAVDWKINSDLFKNNENNIVAQKD